MSNSLQSHYAASYSVLAVGAHPDDIELGCGGTMKKLVNAGVHVRAIVFSKGRRGQINEKDRQDETRNALNILGITDVFIYDFEDTRLWQSVNEMVSTLDKHVCEITPSRMYTMFQHDRHQDHRAVYESCAISGRPVPILLGYETPSSYPNFTPTVFEQIGEQLESKVHALSYHKSQKERLYMQSEKILSAANFRGAQVSLGPCEGFIPYKLVM